MSFSLSIFLLALLDPRWVEERKRQIEDKQQEEEVFAEGLNIASNIQKLAKKRTDIFGVEETIIGKEVSIIHDNLCTCVLAVKPNIYQYRSLNPRS